MVCLLLYNGESECFGFTIKVFCLHDPNQQVGGAAIELLTSTLAFWKQTGRVYQAEHPRDPTSKTGSTREALKNPLTWIFALFIFGYMGAEGTSPGQRAVVCLLF